MSLAVPDSNVAAPGLQYAALRAHAEALQHGASGAGASGAGARGACASGAGASGAGASDRVHSNQGGAAPGLQYAALRAHAEALPHGASGAVASVADPRCGATAVLMGRLGVILVLLLSSISFDALRGVRIGEARRPGPAPRHSLDSEEWTEFLEEDDEYPVAAGAQAQWDSDAAAIADIVAEATLRQAQSLREAEPFIFSKSFRGERSGYVFKLGQLGLGYYLDVGPESSHCLHLETVSPPQLAYLVPPAADSMHRVHLSLDVLVPADPEAAKAGKQPRPRGRQRRRKRATRCRGQPGQWTEGPHPEFKAADDSFRKLGFWAVDSLNGNVSSTAVEFLNSSAADFFCGQELRDIGPATRATERAAKKAKWSLAVGQADPTTAGSTSAGVAVGARANLGFSEAQATRPLPQFASRIKVGWAGSYCRGGIHLLSVYLHHSEGRSKRNMDLLQEAARLIASLEGPWVMAGDLNMLPAELQASGFLNLVKGELKTSGAATCGDKEYDYFIVDRRLAPLVVAVGQIVDAGTSPHTPVRLILRGRPRQHLVRQLVAPTALGAALPPGCLSEGDDLSWLEIACEGDAEQFGVEYLDSAYSRWVGAVEDKIADIADLDAKQRAKFCVRQAGTRFVMRTAIGRPGSSQPRTSAVTVAWKTIACWMLTFVQALANPANQHLAAKATRTKWHLANHQWRHLGTGIHQEAVRQWCRAVPPAALASKASVAWLRATALAISRKTAEHDRRRAQASWESWLVEGPARGIRRQHALTRVDSGWIPSVVAEVDDVDPAEQGETEIEEWLQLEAAGGAAAPLCGQAEVDSEASKWMTEWASHLPRPSLPWPSHISVADLPTLTVEVASKAARSFPDATGLGWDKLHPKSVLRCGDEAILAFIRMLILAEVLGHWPQLVGLVIICLLPKDDGGRRPIGLLPMPIRWWMRMRLDVVRTWQTQHERPFFYAGKLKGATVAAWKQAACAELAATSDMFHYAAVLLDLVKCFERVPLDWLVRQGKRYSYPMAILRLCVAAYRIGRAIGVDGIFSAIILATRGIVAGSVTATTELRALLIEFLDETVSIYKSIDLTVYVDDSGIESIGSMASVTREVIGATRHITNALVEIGMEWSKTKNGCCASSKQLADGIVQALHGLNVNSNQRQKSLGGALGAGKVRNAKVARKRLKAFRTRRQRFRVLRRAVGAARTDLVLRTGGIAGLVYGQANTGVSDSFLLDQRRAVAAAPVLAGSGDLDISLMFIDGGPRGRADPMYEAHAAPIGMWAEAIWHQWLPVAALNALFTHAVATLTKTKRIWSSVKGPAAAYVASAWRLGWTTGSWNTASDDMGRSLAFTRDAPRFVRDAVYDSARRWRWRRIEHRLPALQCHISGVGAFMTPIFRLMSGKPRTGWGPEQKGGLRSLVSGRQWPQCRLSKAKLSKARSPNCRLCVAYGFCCDDTDDPKFTGTLVHRYWTCPVSRKFREEQVPRWLLNEVTSKLAANGGLSCKDHLLFTRALVSSPAAMVPPPPQQETFNWVVRPREWRNAQTVYVDASRLDAGYQLCGLCPRQGWAFAVADDEGRLVAAAHGRPPGWIDSIHGAELWALLMSALNTDPFLPILGDCLSVVEGARRGAAWAQAPQRKLARAWLPLAAALDDATRRVEWMPAHTSTSNIGVRLKGDGQPITEVDRSMNDYVDMRAKEVAEADRMPIAARRAVISSACKLTAVATWLGVCTSAVNRWPRPDGDSANGTLRDCEPATRHSFRRAKERKQVVATRARLSAACKAKQRKVPRCRKDTPWRTEPAPLPRNLGRPPRASVPVARSGRGKKRPVDTAEQLPLCSRWVAVKARLLTRLSVGQ